jgi:hypothetical protein
MEDAATWATVPLASKMGMEYAIVYAPASDTLEYSVKEGWRRATAFRNLWKKGRSGPGANEIGGDKMRGEWEDATARGAPPRNAAPHHGLLMVLYGQVVFTNPDRLREWVAGSSRYCG